MAIYNLFRYNNIQLPIQSLNNRQKCRKHIFIRFFQPKLEARKNEGCLAVEMELAGVQAVCDFYGWDLYDFLVTGDVLDQAVYDVSGLANANHNMDKFYIAIEIAKRI